MKVSCVMANCNKDPKELKEAIDSVLNQSMQDFELIVIDNGSTNGDKELLEELAKENNKIRVFINEKNMGVSYSRNRGIREAKGEYLAFMDSDDINTKDRFELQVNFLNSNPNIDMVGGGSMYFGDTTGNQWIIFNSPDDLKCHIQFGNPFSFGSTMLRRKSIIDNNLYFDSEFDSWEDWEWFVRCSKVLNISAINKIIYFGRMHPRNAPCGVKGKTFNDVSPILYKEIWPEEKYKDLNENAWLVLCGIKKINQDNYEDVKNFCIDFLEQNKNTKEYNQKSLKKILYKKLAIWILNSDMDKKKKIELLLKTKGLVNINNINYVIEKKILDINNKVKGVGNDLSI